MQGIRTIAIITAVGVMLSAGSVLAKSDSTKKTTARAKTAVSRVAQKTQNFLSFEDRLKEKVAAGTITQEEADKLLADHQAKLEEMKTKAKEKVAEMLANGKITQEQADKMLAAIDEGKLPQGGMGMGKNDGKTLEERLAEKVAAGEITQEEADAKLAEQKAKLEEMKTKAKEKVAEQLAAGKITQEQADKMLAAIDEGKMPFGNAKDEFMGERKNIEEIVAEKVAAGTITQEEADKILADHAAKLEEMKTKAKEKVAEQLAAGTITQEQADEMLAKIDEGKLPFRGGFGKNHKADATTDETTDETTDTTTDTTADA